MVGASTANRDISEAFISRYVRNPATFRPQIHDDDEMMLFALSAMRNDRERALIQYLAQGRQICGDLGQIADFYFGGFGQIGSLLDFACGHGRLTRYLVQEMPADQIWAADIYPSAVTFQEQSFGVHGILSTHEPEAFPPTSPFDCIYVGSLFSHLPQATFARWLQLLFSRLAPDGLLAFSTLDVSLLPPNIPVPPTGHFFSSHSESRSLDTNEYGTAYVTEAFVRYEVRRVLGDVSVHRIPRGLANRQDVYLVSAHRRRPLPSLVFVHSPDGWIEACSRCTDDELALMGWAAGPSTEIGPIGVSIELDSRKVADFVPRMKRPDVQAYFGGAAALESGWHHRVDIAGLPPDTLVHISVQSPTGRNHPILIRTLASVRAWLGSKP